GAAARSRDAARLCARGTDRRARRRRPLHRTHDPRRDRGALSLRPPGARAAPRGRRGRPDPARPQSGGGIAMTGIRLVKDELRPPEPPARRHLISIADLTRDDVERLLGIAHVFEGSLSRNVKKLPTLKGYLVVNLFYE